MRQFLFVIIVLCTVNMLMAQNPDKIIFSHKYHIEEVEAECASCHELASNSLSITDNLLPEMATCYDCHDESDTKCGYCHTNIDEPGMVPRYASFNSKFPHKTHTTDGTNCLSCHEGIPLKKVVGTFHLPSSVSCASCHEPADYKDEKVKCLTCHNKDMNFLPSDHAVNWPKDHGVMDQLGDNTCSHCHQTSYCQSCHEGDNLDRKVHPLNFKSTHGRMAKGNKENCLTCHQEQMFCLDCHQTQMVMPKNHSYVNWSNRVTGNGGRHAKEAKFDFDNCQSCHNDAYSDNVCITCHGN